jgi:predicted transcriptional regulator
MSRTLSLHDEEDAEIFRALSSEVRVRILDLSARTPMNINALGQALGLSAPTVTHHVQALEQAGLVVTEYAQGTQGTQKLCRARYSRLLLSFDEPLAETERIEELEAPVGMYSAATPGGTCGLASSERIIGFYDDPQSFLLFERAEAIILWMAEGYIEYVFPNRLPTTVEIDRLEFAVELGSEAPEFNNDYPSDISIWINGVEIGCWNSPGDFGDRRGRFYPAWWPVRLAQYGILTNWVVTRTGTSVNGRVVSDETLSSISIAPREPITIRIGIKKDAANRGGFTIFGRGIGDHDHSPLLRLYHSQSSS